MVCDIGWQSQDIPFRIEHSNKDVILKVYAIANRSEKSKWIHCFDCVNVLLFMMDVSEYNLVLFYKNINKK